MFRYVCLSHLCLTRERATARRRSSRPLAVILEITALVGHSIVYEADSTNVPRPNPICMKLNGLRPPINRDVAAEALARPERLDVVRALAVESMARKRYIMEISVRVCLERVDECGFEKVFRWTSQLSNHYAIAFILRGRAVLKELPGEMWETELGRLISIGISTNAHRKLKRICIGGHILSGVSIGTTT